MFRNNNNTIDYFNYYEYISWDKTISASDMSIDFVDYIPEDIEEIYLTNNNIYEIPEIPKTALNIMLDYNNFKAMPVMPDTLKSISISNNYITKIETLPKDLTFLNISNNYIEQICDFPDSLLFLFVDNNNLKRLPKLPEGLISIVCDNNKISKLILPQSVTSVHCAFNNLTHLEFSNNLELKDLYCNDNLLSDIINLPPIGTDYYDFSNNRFSDNWKNLAIIARNLKIY